MPFYDAGFNPYMNPGMMPMQSPDFVVPSGSTDLDMLNQAVQYESLSFPPGFGGMQHAMQTREDMMARARAIYSGSSLPGGPNGGPGGPGGEYAKIPPSAGGERDTGRRLLGAGATAAVAGLGAYALLNCWNPTGWGAGAVALGVAGVGALIGFFS